MMQSNRLINLFLLLLLSACTTTPQAGQATLTPGSSLSPAVSATVTPLPAAPAPGVPTPIPARGTVYPLNLTEGLTGNPLSPSWSPNGLYIVFSLDDPAQPNHNQLYAAAIDGSGWWKVVDHPDGNDFLPQWSPDGLHILFCSGAADGSGANVFVVSPEGKDLTQLTHDHASQCQAAWSPDGSQIALISNGADKQSGQLYVMNADGSNLHLAADVKTATDPVWSPDGSTLIFSGQDSSSSGTGMYRARPDGSGSIELIKNPAFEAGMQWSADGKKILYQAGSSLYMINPDGSASMQILPKETDMGGAVRSLDGSWVAFHAKLAGSSQIFVATVDGATLLYYPHPGLEDLFPLFSPDGKKLLFYSHHDHVDDGALLLITFDDLSLWGK